MNCLLLSYNSIKDVNIGDYIQSLAARQYIQSFKYKLIDREKLNLYDGDESHLIMNCWYTSQPDSFPPSKKIKPLFISFHLNSGASYKILSNPSNIEYFKKFEPIGCRDKNTLKKLESKNVKAYFSGCLTTTLYKTYKETISNNKICVVDLVSTIPPYKNIFSKLKDYSTIFLFSIGNLSSIICILRNLKKNCPIRINSIYKFLFYWIYAARTFQIVRSTVHKSNFKKIDYFTHLYESNTFISEEERFKFADMLLKIYAKSSLILTSRLHCILPTLGFDVPSIYFNQVYDDELSACRKEGIIELFNKIELSNSSVVNNPFGKIKDINKIPKKQVFLKYAKKLDLTIKDFLNEKKS